MVHLHILSVIYLIQRTIYCLLENNATNVKFRFITYYLGKVVSSKYSCYYENQPLEGSISAIFKLQQNRNFLWSVDQYRLAIAN